MEFERHQLDFETYFQSRPGFNGFFDLRTYDRNLWYKHGRVYNVLGNYPNISFASEH